ncbi:unnamed protein product [Ectocarpus sp. 4 AP-2014]
MGPTCTCSIQHHRDHWRPLERTPSRGVVRAGTFRFDTGPEISKVAASSENSPKSAPEPSGVQHLLQPCLPPLSGGLLQ